MAVNSPKNSGGRGKKVMRGNKMSEKRKIQCLDCKNLFDAEKGEELNVCCPVCGSYDLRFIIGDFQDHTTIREVIMKRVIKHSIAEKCLLNLSLRFVCAEKIGGTQILVLCMTIHLKCDITKEK